MRDFEEAIRAHGLRPKYPPQPDGRWRRCPTEDKPKSTNGAYKLTLDGRVGFYQNHALEESPVIWRADGHDTDSLPRQIDYDELRRKRKEQREFERKRIRAARDFYEECRPLRGGHPYLDDHGLDMTGCMGLKVDRDGWLVIPALRSGRLISLQRIAPDGEKKFWYGAPFSGVSYAVDRPGASITVLCEGLATGLAVFAAAPLTRVVVAFTGGNMVKVARAYAGGGMITVAADNDHRTRCRPHKDSGLEVPFEPWEDRPEWCRCNPGRCYAAEAAEALECGYMLPTGMDGTDWCDWREERAADRLEARPYGSRETEATIRRAVDAEIAMEVQRRARFVVPQRSAS